MSGRSSRKKKREEEEEEGDGEAGEEEGTTTNNNIEKEEINEDIKEKKKKKKKQKREEEIVDELDDDDKGDIVKGKEVEIEKEGKEMFEIYVEGIPYSQNENDLSQLFSSHGFSVLKVNLPRWHDSGRPRGYAHIGLISEQERDRALKEMNGLKIQGRYLAISVANGKNKGSSATTTGQGISSSSTVPDNCTILFVKNLPYETTEEEVKVCFEKYGKVESVRLARWNHTENLKGFGHITFDSKEELVKAMNKAKKSWFKVGGRDLKVDFELQPQPPPREGKTATTTTKGSKHEHTKPSRHN
jgi:nucleolin